LITCKAPWKWGRMEPPKFAQPQLLHAPTRGSERTALAPGDGRDGVETMGPASGRVHDGYQAARRMRHGDVGRPNTLRSSILARSSRRLSDEDSDRPERLMYRLSIDMAD
jgi:hypothetical protein